MDKKEKIWIASVALGKGMDYENLFYSDYMYGKEEETESVWEYVVEAQEEGMKWFRENYSEYKLY